MVNLCQANDLNTSNSLPCMLSICVAKMSYDGRTGTQGSSMFFAKTAVTGTRMTVDRYQIMFTRRKKMGNEKFPNASKSPF